MKVRRTIRVSNTQGLHARPCHAIVSTALEFESDLKIANGSNLVNGKSILELMTLNAGFGVELEVFAEGADAQELLERLVALFDSGFGEEGT